MRPRGCNPATASMILSLLGCIMAQPRSLPQSRSGAWGVALSAVPKLARMGKALARPALRPVPASRLETADYPDLDCLAGRLPSRVLLAAAIRSERVGVGADRVLIASGAIDEETYVRALAEHLGIRFEPL